MIEAGVLTIVIIWVVIALVCLILLIAANVKLLHFMMALTKQTKKKTQEIMVLTREKYNAIGTMKSTELDDYLAKIFSLELDLCSASQVSELDHKAIDTLYATSLVATLNYIGRETLDAIDYYYGPDYVIRWCKLRYATLENQHALEGIINKTSNVSQINTKIVK